MNDNQIFVIKRNGDKVPFDKDKIRAAIEKAFNSVGKGCTPDVIDSIIDKVNVRDGISVEEIQKIVPRAMMDKGYYDVAESYIIYKERHKESRFIRERLDYMDKYANSNDNAATSSETDPNANVTQKNVANLEAEVYKSKNRDIQRQRMKDKLNEMFPEVAKQYEEDLNHHIIYCHDEASSPTLKQYTYSPKESVYAKIDNLKVLCSFETLYELSHAIPHEVEPGVYIKQPNNIFVKDKDGWTKVTCLTKKARHRDLYRVKTSFGEDLIVTDNHPMIVGNSKDETVNAVDSLGYTQFRTSDVPEFGDTKFIDLTDCVQVDYSSESFVMRHETQAPYYFAKRKVEITRELGYAIGFFIGDGNYDNTCHNLSYSQKDRKPLLRIADALFDSFGVCSSIVLNQNNKWILTVHSDIVYDVFRNFFRIKDKAWNKSLPYNLLEFPKEFSAGIIEGIIDSDGTVQDNSINIRLSSREAITQLTILLRAFGYGVANSVQNCPFGQNKAIKTNYTLWGVIFTNTPNSYTFSGSYKAKELGETDKGLKYSTGNAKITNVSKIENCSYLELCDYIYDITTESNTLMCNNLWAHNCMAVSLYPLMLEGVGNIDGVTPSEPNDLQSFSGQITNLTFLLSSQCKGAVAFGEYFIALNYYIIKEFGPKWYEKLDYIISSSHCLQQRTIRDSIHKAFKQFLYGVNQPAGNRAYQSPFTNISYYDKTYFQSLFGDFYYPDGSKPEWKAIDTLQRMFMKFFNKLRTKQILTFPVETMAMVHDGKDIIDKEYKDFTAEMYAEGHSFFTYISDSADSLASCCFSKDTKILWKSTTSGVNCTSLEYLHNAKWNPLKENLKIFHNGSWVHGKTVKLPNRRMFKVITANNKEFILTDNHINVTYNGEITTDKLTTDDYLLFNTQVLNAVPENDEHLTYSQGFVIGAFLGDGSFGRRFKEGTIYDINFSQNKNKYLDCITNVNQALKDMGEGDKECCLNEPYNNVYPVRVSSKKLVAFIQKWTNWTEGTYCYNKKLNLNCLLQSVEFRRGILDGWYNTDGGNSNRCYTTSPELASAMEILITSLGMNSIINISDRTNEEVIIRDEGFNRNFSLYCVRWYEPANHRTNKDSCKSWKKKNNGIYFKIKSIEEVEYKDDVYCIECRNQDEPYFTLPSGLITHNCRLKNELTENTFSPTSGLTGVMTGSCNVITLNINRLVQDWFHSESEDGNDLHTFYAPSSGFAAFLRPVLERVYKYHIAYKTMLYEMEDKGMFAASNGGYIHISKLYSTIGINGLNEAAEFLKMTVSNNDEYFEFLQLILGTIKEQNKLHSIQDNKRPFLFNSEVVPAEGLGGKNYRWDKEDGLEPMSI